MMKYNFFDKMCQKVIWGRSSDVSDDFLKKHLFCSEMIQVAGGCVAIFPSNWKIGTLI